MIGAALDVTLSIIATAAVILGPGAALLWASGLASALPAAARPAAAVVAGVLAAAAALAVTLATGGSLVLMITLLVALSLAAMLAATIRRRRRPADIASRHPGVRERLQAALPFVPPGVVVAIVALLDSPNVRSDTYWHVALVRKLTDVESLGSAALAFEAGAAGNANYPLPAWHALLAAASRVPHVDAWSASWFVTCWLAPVAMLAFGSMAAILVGDRRACVAGCWGFVTVVLLGYGPWYFASRYLAYPGQVAIYVALPVALVALALALERDGVRRRRLLVIAAACVVAIGLLHGNYALYPVLFAAGAAVLLATAARPLRAAVLGTAAVTVAGAVTLAAQLPWLRRDENFLRGSGAPAGEPSAFMRHRDVFVGSEQSYHVEIGSLATQPLLVVGALAIPLVLLARRRTPGPWLLAGGAVAIVAVALSSPLVAALDRAGTVTPVTRFDRVYPAAVGVVGVALAIGWLLHVATRRRPAALRWTAVAAAGALVGAAVWWADSIRDTRRIVVTPFVEARWVGGLQPAGVPRAAVAAATLGILVVCIVLGVRRWRRRGERGERGGDAAVAQEALPERARRIAAVMLAAGAVGLAPATVERLQAAFKPEAYVEARRHDRRWTPIEVYPASSRRVVNAMREGSVVLANLQDVRQIASLAPVQVVDESLLRQIEAEPPSSEREAAELLDRLVDEWGVDYVASRSFDPEFRPLLDAAAAQPRRFEQVGEGFLVVYRVRD